MKTFWISYTCFQLVGLVIISKLGILLLSDFWKPFKNTCTWSAQLQSGVVFYQNHLSVKFGISISQINRTSNIYISPAFFVLFPQFTFRKKLSESWLLYKSAILWGTLKLKLNSLTWQLSGFTAHLQCNT